MEAEEKLAKARRLQEAREAEGHIEGRLEHVHVVSFLYYFLCEKLFIIVIGNTSYIIIIKILE